jgi:hypothetical protein
MIIKIEVPDGLHCDYPTNKNCVGIQKFYDWCVIFDKRLSKSDHTPLIGSFKCQQCLNAEIKE